MNHNAVVSILIIAFMGTMALPDWLSGFVDLPFQYYIVPVLWMGLCLVSILIQAKFYVHKLMFRVAVSFSIAGLFLDFNLLCQVALLLATLSLLNNVKIRYILLLFAPALLTAFNWKLYLFPVAACVYQLFAVALIGATFFSICSKQSFLKVTKGSLCNLRMEGWR